MNNDMRDSLDSLLLEENRDEMWEKFFNLAQYNDKFIEALNAYKSVSQDISDLEYNLSDVVAQEWYEAYSKIKNDVAELKKERENIDLVISQGLDDGMSNVHKRLLENRKVQIENEIRSKASEYSKLQVFKKQKVENENEIKEKKGFLEEWYNALKENFNAKDGIKAQLLNNAEKANRELDEKCEQLERKVANTKKNADHSYKLYLDAIKYGKYSEQYAEAARKANDDMAIYVAAKEELNSFYSNLTKMDIDLIKFIHFLKNCTFEEFFEKLSNRDFNLDLGKGTEGPEMGGPEGPGTGAPEGPDSGTDGGTSDPKPEDEEEKDTGRDKPEQPGGGSDGGTGDSEPEGGSEDETGDSKPEDEEEKDEGKDKPEQPGGDSDGGTGDSEPEDEDDKDKEEDKDKDKKRDGKKKKVKKIRDIPKNILDMVAKIIPSLRGLQLQESLSNPVVGASALQVITAISDNDYAKKDKKLLGSIRDRIKNVFGSKKNQNYDHYSEMYSKVMNMNDAQAQNWFKNVTIKEELLENIKSCCNLSEEQYKALMTKVGVEVEEVQEQGRGR